jgi:CO/xanthine dehydrogenase FAD-binding subunit
MQAFEYLSPKSLKAAFQAIRGRGFNYRVVAGGTNFVPNLRDGTVRPKRVVDLGGLKMLSYIKEKNGLIKVGATTTIADLLKSPLIERQAPVLWAACSQFAGPVVRNRATVGGNLADASPAADTAVPLLALKARVRLRSLDGQRTLALDKFFTGYRKTAIQSGEILTEVAFPIPYRGTKYGYHKLGRRNAMAISVASVAVVLEMRGKTCKDAAIALGAVAPVPLRIAKAEALLKGKNVDVELAQKCGEVVAGCVKPIDDIRATAEYRRTVSQVLVCRGICEALELDS